MSARCWSEVARAFLICCCLVRKQEAFVQSPAATRCSPLSEWGYKKGGISAGFLKTEQCEHGLSRRRSRVNRGVIDSDCGMGNDGRATRHALADNSVTNAGPARALPSTA